MTPPSPPANRAATVLSPFRTGRHNHARCITAAIAAAERICRESGLRLTPLRHRVLELVWREHAPVRAYDVLDRLRDEGRRAAPPTVYRALDFLLEHGFVHRIETLNAYVGCGDPNTSHSGQFLICRHCNAVAELDDPRISSLVSERAGDLGFAAGQQTIEILGTCPRCREGARQ